MINWLLGLTFFFINTSFANDALKFSDELISDGDYFRALSVLKQNEFSSRGSLNGSIYQKRILTIHFRSQNFEEFDIQVDRLLSRYSKFLPKHDPSILNAEVSFYLKNYPLAYDQIKETNATQEQKHYFRVYAGSNERIPKCNSKVCLDIDNIEAEILNNKSYKNEYLALSLGIIPGMGQVYAGHTSSGIATFILNGLMILTSITAFNNGETVLGWVSAGVGSTFYLSSIYAGLETAKRYNRALREQSMNKLKNIPVEFQLLKIAFE
ncbi:MAG TPA: hypothetical protein VNJ08_12600 [Bacteriovoracaceae bacterium]|nr:hypothetical protein [Bacteriovoracaceae bacterium]